MNRGEELRSVEDYDREIEALQAERDRLKSLCADPEQIEARRLRREQLAGRWVVTRPLPREHVAAIRQVAGAGEAWLWDDDMLTTDGWVQDDQRNWSLLGTA